MENLTIGTILVRLSKEPPTKILKQGWDWECSYRGDYYQLGLHIVQNVSIQTMMDVLKRAIGHEYCGYKGGMYRMESNTECYLIEEDRSSFCPQISDILLEYMIKDEVLK